VKLLIAVREIISLWEEGDIKTALIITRKNDSESSAGAVEYY